MMYQFISNTHEISLKEIASDPVNGTTIAKYPPGSVFVGDYLRFIPVDMEFGRIGDFALHVTEIDGVAVEGWVNVVYQGEKYGKIEIIDAPKAFEYPPEVTLSKDDTDSLSYVPKGSA